MNNQNHTAPISADVLGDKSRYLQATVAATVARAVRIRRNIGLSFERWKMAEANARTSP